MQNRLTPNLGKLFSTIKEEHDFGMARDLPKMGCELLHLGKSSDLLT